MQYIKVFKDDFKRTWLLLEVSGYDMDNHGGGYYGMLKKEYKGFGYPYPTNAKSIVDVDNSIWNFADDIVRFEDWLTYTLVNLIIV